MCTLDDAKDDKRYLELLADKFPTVSSAATEIINLEAILSLPKGTEHFLSDLHGESTAFTHVLKNASGQIRRKVDDIFGMSMREADKRELCSLIYYPEEKLALIKEQEQDARDLADWYRMSLHQVVEVARFVTVKYTRSKVRKMMPSDFAYVIEELLFESKSESDRQDYYNAIINAIVEIDRADALLIAICNLIHRLIIDKLHIVGDIFDRFVRTAVPEAYTTEARARGMSIHAYLREKASAMSPGESGLVALDWFNGNRSVLGNASLTGLIMGMTLTTKPEETYRALIEAAAYGTRRIFEQYERYGIPVGEVTAAGGIAGKDPMMMQIMADVTGKVIRVSARTEASAMGSAVYAAVAGGLYPSVAAASAAFRAPDTAVYVPIPENLAVYERLYAVYRTLHDTFGDGRVMETLGKIRDGARK